MACYLEIVAEVEQDYSLTRNTDGDDCQASDNESVSDTISEDFDCDDVCHDIIWEKSSPQTDRKIFMITGSPGTGIFKRHLSTITLTCYLLLIFNRCLPLKRFKSK